jgi:ParB family chromosome partitioning protein
MSKRKSFGISPSLSQGLSETVSLVENDEGVFRTVRIPMARIEKDPDNPRRLDITPEDIINGLDKSDEKFDLKNKQLEEIKELAFSIETSGLINPISVFKHTDKYRIIAGERRYLAVLFSNKKEIDARVLQRKPTKFDLKLLQWFENTNREDLSIHEKLQNVMEILEARGEGDSSQVHITGKLIETITGMSSSQAAVYATILTGPTDIYDAIKSGAITNLKVAMLLAKCTNASKRKMAIEKCKEGVSPAKAKEIIAAIMKVEPSKKETKQEAKLGRKRNKIMLGATKNTTVVQTIVQAVTALPKFTHYSNNFNEVNWNDFDTATSAFTQLIEMIEAEV